MLAYSTISHLGFILLALTISSIESTQAFIFYLMQYSISNLNVFIILVTIGFSLVRRLAFIVVVPEGIRVMDILCKSVSLPKTEMVKGPKHASKVGSGIMANMSYNNLRDKFSHGVFVVLVGLKTTPVVARYTTVFEFGKSVKSFLKSISEKQYLTKIIELSPNRKVTNIMQRNSGSPKGGNLYR